jgi:hypothetical protein
MEFHAALIADGLSVVFWSLIIASVVLGYFWLESMVEHLSLVKGWKRGAALGASVLGAMYLDAKIDELRSVAPGFEPGEATFMAFWLLLSATLLVGPFVLLFSSAGGKSDSHQARDTR